jgi:hypothetical protein
MPPLHQPPSASLSTTNNFVEMYDTPFVLPKDEEWTRTAAHSKKEHKKQC